MVMDMDAVNSEGFTAKRNKAIIHAISKHLSLDPQKAFLSKSAESCDIETLVINLLQSSSEDTNYLKNHEEVKKWASFASNLSDLPDSRHETLKDLNDELAHKSVLLGGLKPSSSDVIVFSVVHGFVSHLSEEEMQKYPNLIRWIDYVQNTQDFGGAFDMIVVNKPQFTHFGSGDILDAYLTKKIVQSPQHVKSDGNMDVKKELLEFKEKPPVTDEVSSDSNKVKGTEMKVSTEVKKKCTEEKKKISEKSSEIDTDCSVSILNLQVGLIRKVWKHPSADSLLVEEIDLGDGIQRQVVSGLAKYYSPEDLTNLLVVLITNVKPGKLRDVMSSGLVLCASNNEHTIVEPLTVPEGAKIGERVSFSGFEGKSEDVLNPKKKQLDKITPHLYTDDKGVATYKGIPFMTSAGPCTSSLANASIK